ncbi:hypothetical protein IB276_33245 [Ensifer sp. ENS04]|uniref:hypothetical protein n=1 Tax=Ensifer sp. ENS04 TaxID=2769281 RepID=UPI0017847CDE|nr:hypothetical protein [Ensifer sp. ENS04]MBD9544314.1 hypothetical protein [Ensifer sp. ENS04]
MKPPEVTPIEDLPAEVVSALYVVVAYMANNGQAVLNITLEGLHTDDHMLGDYEFSVRRTDV